MSCKGKVKSFNPNKGFGFITDKSGDIFVLDKNCTDGKQLAKGDVVFFDKELGTGGTCKHEAKNVTGGTGAPVVSKVEVEGTKIAEKDGAETKALPTSPDVLPVSKPAMGYSEGEAPSADVTLESCMDASPDAKATACAGQFDSMHSAYVELGTGYYEVHGQDYTNPHEPAISRALVTALDKWSPKLELPLRRVHDLACGSGEASAAFLKWPGCEGCSLDASDPHTFAAYEKRMGRPAHRWSFEDLAGGLLDDMQPYDLAIGCFALHLLEKSYQQTTFAALARSFRFLLVLTPHKRPVIEPSTGWRQVDELLQDRVRVRLYASDRARRLDKEMPAEHSEYTIICRPPLQEEEAVVDPLNDDNVDVVSELISNMNTYDLREALIKRGLSTAGKRSEWGDRLMAAVTKKQEPETSPDAPHEGEISETLKIDDKEDVQSTTEDEEVSEDDEDDEEEEEEEEDEEDVEDNESLNKEEFEAMAAKKAAIKATLAAKRKPRVKSAAAQAKESKKTKDDTDSKKKSAEKAALKAMNVDQDVKDTRMQGNFGLTKFIKP